MNRASSFNFSSSLSVQFSKSSVFTSSSSHSRRSNVEAWTMCSAKNDRNYLEILFYWKPLEYVHLFGRHLLNNRTESVILIVFQSNVKYRYLDFTYDLCMCPNWSTIAFEVLEKMFNFFEKGLAMDFFPLRELSHRWTSGVNVTRYSSGRNRPSVE